MRLFLEIELIILANVAMIPLVIWLLIALICETQAKDHP